METTQNDLDTKLSAIDRALAAAAARKAAKAAAHSESSGTLRRVETTEVEAPAAKPMKKDPAAKAAREAERMVAQKKREAEREARRAAKAVEAESGSKKVAHMKKVERAASKLPALNDAATLLFNEAVVNFSAEQLAALALHIQHFNRVKATERAVNQRVETGSRVRIVGGDPKFIGREGVVSLARRIRCFVDVPGVNKPVYLFTSDVQVLEAARESAEAVG